MAIDWQSVGTVLGGLGTAAVAAWGFWQKQQRTQAQTRAEVAEANSTRAVADAEGAVYKLLTNRLQTLERDMEHLREDLAHERKRTRRMELHIGRLEGLMRKAGIEPPTFDEHELRSGDMT